MKYRVSVDYSSNSELLMAFSWLFRLPQIWWWLNIMNNVLNSLHNILFKQWSTFSQRLQLLCDKECLRKSFLSAAIALNNECWLGAPLPVTATYTDDRLLTWTCVFIYCIRSSHLLYHGVIYHLLFICIFLTLKINICIYVVEIIHRVLYCTNIECKANTV